MYGKFTQIRKKNYKYFESPLLLNVTATDIGGKLAWDTLEILVDPSDIYIVIVISIVLGPLISVFGIVKFLYLFYNIFCFKRYVYNKTISIKTGNLYEK